MQIADHVRYLLETIMIKIIAAAVAASLLALAGCNTMQGLGQDIERGGEKLQEKAKK